MPRGFPPTPVSAWGCGLWQLKKDDGHWPPPFFNCQRGLPELRQLKKDDGQWALPIFNSQKAFLGMRGVGRLPGAAHLPWVGSLSKLSSPAQVPWWSSSLLRGFPSGADSACWYSSVGLLCPEKVPCFAWPAGCVGGASLPSCLAWDAWRLGVPEPSWAPGLLVRQASCLARPAGMAGLGDFVSPSWRPGRLPGPWRPLSNLSQPAAEHVSR